MRRNQWTRRRRRRNDDDHHSGDEGNVVAIFGVDIFNREQIFKGPKNCNIVLNLSSPLLRLLVETWLKQENSSFFYTLIQIIILQYR